MLHLDLPAGTRVWASSDHHFNHKRIIELSNRPFQSLGHMNTEIVRRHNAVVGPDDVFIACGDLGMGDFAEALEFAAMLAGIKYLVPGNHDRTSQAFNSGKDADRYRHRYEDAGFIVLPESGVTIDIHGVRFAVCHYPYFGDHTERDRHVALRPEDEGLPLLHGHLHDTRRIDGRMFNVGVDVNNFTPVSEEQMLAFAENAA
jgi:calcineurin-like phosphoesterase family protein